MIKKIGKETLKAKYKKDQVACDVKAFAQIITQDGLDVEASYVDEGKTENGYEFATIRFYMKHRENS